MIVKALIVRFDFPEIGLDLAVTHKSKRDTERNFVKNHYGTEDSGAESSSQKRKTKEDESGTANKKKKNLKTKTDVVEEVEDELYVKLQQERFAKGFVDETNGVLLNNEDYLEQLLIEGYGENECAIFLEFKTQYESLGKKVSWPGGPGMSKNAKNAAAVYTTSQLKTPPVRKVLHASSSHAGSSDTNYHRSTNVMLDQQSSATAAATSTSGYSVDPAQASILLLRPVAPMQPRHPLTKQPVSSAGDDKTTEDKETCSPSSSGASSSDDADDADDDRDDDASVDTEVIDDKLHAMHHSFTSSRAPKKQPKKMEAPVVSVVVLSTSFCCCDSFLRVLCCVVLCCVVLCCVVLYA